jgi:hypothetical protein
MNAAPSHPNCCVQEAGIEILKMSAAELKALEEEDTARFEAHMQDTLHRPFLFKIKVAEDTYQDETRIKTSIMK